MEETVEKMQEMVEEMVRKVVHHQSDGGRGRKRLSCVTFPAFMCKHVTTLEGRSSPVVLL